MKHINLQTLTSILVNTKGACFATIVSETQPKMRKKDNPYFDRVTKLSVNKVMINFIYANAVNNALGREGKDTDFVPKQRAWGTHIEGTCIIEHKGNHYLECRVFSADKPVFMIDGQPTQKATVEPWLQEANSNADHQGLDYENEVIVRDFKFSSIKEVKINKEHYIIG